MGHEGLRGLLGLQRPPGLRAPVPGHIPGLPGELVEPADAGGEFIGRQAGPGPLDDVEGVEGVHVDRAVEEHGLGVLGGGPDYQQTLHVREEVPGEERENYF